MLPLWLPVINKFFSVEERKKKTEKENVAGKSAKIENVDVNEIAGSIEGEIIRKKHPLSSGCRKVDPIVLVHGGAGNIPDYLVPFKLNCVKKAATAGYKVMRDGGSAVEAVEAAIRVMEDDPVMNAGKGSVLNYDGEVEVDACIMSGQSLDAGGVTAVKNVAHPISLAKMVMEKTPHVLLAGTGATKFALQNGVRLEEPGSLVTEAAEAALKAYKENPKDDLNQEMMNVSGENQNDDIWPRTESVGAIAIDHKGHIAVGASSGGWNGKDGGKFNEACSIGGGIYADDAIGAVSLTGYGKYMMRMMLAFRIMKEMEHKNALNSCVHWLNMLYGKFEEHAGVVGITNYGNIGIYFNTERMPWAYQKKNILYYGIDPNDERRDIAC